MITLSKTELYRLTVRLLTASHSSDSDAEAVARSLVWADLHGRHAQGIFRLPVLAKMLGKGLITSPAVMTWSGHAPAVYHLDAGNGFGQVAGELAVKKAIEVARVMGIGMVTVNRSNHYGAAGYYAAIAAESGCMGITSTNASPKVAPYGGTTPVLGTNPIAFGCPVSAGKHILVDFSTSAIAGSTVRSMNENGSKLPEGVALDASGNPTTDPAALSTGSILSAAGAKGYGLGMMVEVLCGILSGAGMSFEVGPYYTTLERKENCGHTFIAIDISHMQPMSRYFRRTDELIAAVKGSPGINHIPVRYPGEVRADIAERYEREGIPLADETVRLLEQLALESDTQLPWKQTA